MNSIGSVWRKWDLHIHTPASYHWKGQKFEGQSGATLDANCLAVIEAINKADADAFCIMDYWTFDGFIALRNYVRRNPGALTKKVFPGLEFRLEASTDYRLNAHVLLNDSLDDEELIAFHNHLKFSGPNGQPPIRANFIKLAKGYSENTLQKHGYSDADRVNADKMLELGMKTAELSRDSLRIAISMIKKENCLFILPYDTNDGFEKHDWELHPYADHSIMQWADCYEAKDPIVIRLILGKGHPTNPNVTKNFMTTIGCPKPVFRGSDAHKTSEYAVYPNGKTTWLKAQPTFAGLRQVCHEPSLRCHIGDPPGKLVHIQQNPTKYIKSIRLSKVDGSTFAEDWFDGVDVQFNTGLIAVIGNKGMGKSALADILALAANSHREEFQFLTPERFRGSGNKAQHFNAVLTWLDGTETTVNLSQSVNQTSPERVRYLPQNIIEDLCNEISVGNDSRFSCELRQVIFAHVDTADKLGMVSLDDLIAYRLQAKKESCAQVQQSIRQVNEIIAKKEHEASSESVNELRSALVLKENELEALNKSPIEEVTKPVANPDDEKTKAIMTRIANFKFELETIETDIDKVNTERDQLVAERARLTRLTEYIGNFKQYHEAFGADHSEEFAAAGFPIGDVIKVQIDSKGFTTRLAEVEDRIASLNTKLNGTPAINEMPAVPGLVSSAETFRAKIQTEENSLELPEKLYQKYLRDAAEREMLKGRIVGTADQPDTIEYLKARIERVTKVIPAEISRHCEERRSLVKQLHSQVLEMRAVYEKLYAPIQKMATNAATSPHAVQIQFDAKIVTNSFEENFLDFIHRGRRGHFFLH